MEPLAYRMCPRDLKEFVGQDEIIGRNKILDKMINTGVLHSMILFGPPGTGKTTIAKIIANTSKLPFKRLNAVTSGVSDIKKVVEETKNYFSNPAKKAILFLDEIHRFNKSQQDVLLPHVEDGTIILIGATTQNPFYEVNKALISRVRVFMLKQLTQNDILSILKNALEDEKRGLGNYKTNVKDDVLLLIAKLSGGDARVALNTLELVVGLKKPNKQGVIKLEEVDVLECVQIKNISYDKNSDNHFDTISALIKSMRGSDPDATILYLAKALEAGEDCLYLARRIVICASEDVGLANPGMLTLTMSAYEAVKVIGMPEASIILAQAAIAVAKSVKSNTSYIAIKNALKDVREKDIGPIPFHLRNATVKSLEDFDYSIGYKYPHDYTGNYVEQNYMPENFKGVKYYKPSENDDAAN